ncbi:uncharacterized protein LOC128234131 [Mya arenaria]|uniref:uncharacterized protein LOC128234131 n=1 Tax=Mya arenaria TaxID=6604 RepID=UPI0022E36B1B|nr:uncharacterized protein LOC128234131 [Mya arenaria]
MKIDKTWNGKEMCCRKKSAIYGNIKATCKILDMKYGPVVDMAEELSVEEGRNLSLRCKYNHGNPPQESSVVWTRALNNQRWEDTFLQITSVQRADDDIYTCTFTSEMVLSEGISVNGSSNGTMHLNVHYQSTVTYFDVGSEYKDSVTKAENDTVILLCVVNSNPKAEISITKGNDILEVEDNGSNLTHTIASLSCLDAGLYSCTSANRYNRDLPSIEHFEMHVTCSARRPYNVNMKLVFYGSVNENATLTYTAFAYPLPSPSQITWKRCVGNEACMVITTNSSKYFISTNGLSSFLTIIQVKEKDYGYYQLTIWNGIGRALTERLQLKKSGANEISVQEITHLTHAASVGGSIVAMIIGSVMVFYCIRLKVSHCNTCGFRNVNSNSRAEEVELPGTDETNFPSITEILERTYIYENSTEVGARASEENTGEPLPVHYEPLQQIHIGETNEYEHVMQETRFHEYENMDGFQERGERLYNNTEID